MLTFQSAAAVTPHDTNPNVFQALYVGTTGDVAIRPLGQSTDVTFVGAPAGEYIWVATQLVLSTGTTASNIVGVGFAPSR